jgi:molybdenum cofactor cytidylyltransferase
MSTPPVVVILAAGLGSRFDSPRHKLTQPLGSNTVLGQTVGHAIESGLPAIVVTTEALQADAARMVAGRDVVLLPGPKQGVRAFGMGHSIAAGVSARPDACGWLILPGDMPVVRPASLLAVAAALQNHPVVFAQHRGRRGHPVGFAAELYSDLVQLTGDEGARRIVARYPSHGVELDDPGVLIDVDTQADLVALQSGAVAASRRGAV